MIVQSDLGRSVEVRHPERDLPLWRYNYNQRPKPYFYPLCTPAGHNLALYEPHDHHWQRGLWYAIKFVNGDNFWEEEEPFGSQRTNSPLTIAQEWSGRVRVESRLVWQRPADRAVVLREERAFVFHPGHVGSYALDFETTLEAAVDVTLDRTPFTTWGGYGGLTFRGTRNWAETRLLFADGTTSERPTGHRAPWCDLSGKLDGGLDRTGGLAIFDHPDNPRHPVPWYGNNQPGMYFLCAAFLFEEPMTLPQGEKLAFRYRVVVHDGIWEPKDLKQAYEVYTAKAKT